MKILRAETFEQSIMYILNDDGNIEEVNVLIGPFGKQYRLFETEEYLELEDMDGWNVYDSADQVFNMEILNQHNIMRAAALKIERLEKDRDRWLRESGKS